MCVLGGVGRPLVFPLGGLSFKFSLMFSLAVAQAPLKPKTPRGTKTPINRNQLTQNRGLGGIMVKRAYETVS